MVDVFKCSSPCAIFEDETRPCSTEHDRKCTSKWTEPIIPVSGTPSTVNDSKEIPSTTSSTVEKGDQGSDESDYSPELNESPLVKKPWFWIVLVGVRCWACGVTCNGGCADKMQKKTAEEP
ncbi:hypothetical protein OS493_013383 [Desmophyllum pertusum]|uniref:Uncharacterized protein n=1 Tax=Desmophyllum pertusum TaxID=174260 RepID=A0A9W9YDI8_9CNID|nr:hypothetical protein OS493_013383 [Desmophyllum pertusum]